MGFFNIMTLSKHCHSYLPNLNNNTEAFLNYALYLMSSLCNCFWMSHKFGKSCTNRTRVFWFGSRCVTTTPTRFGGLNRIRTCVRGVAIRCFYHSAISPWWARLESNQLRLALQASALPLSYKPMVRRERFELSGAKRPSDLQSLHAPYVTIDAQIKPTTKVASISK